MAAPGFSLRIPPALRAVMDAEAQRQGVALGALILDTCAERFMGTDSEPERRRPAPKAAKPAVSADPRVALTQAESRVGVRPVSVASAVMSGVPLGGAKRPAYQKGQAGQGKARRQSSGSAS